MFDLSNMKTVKHLPARWWQYACLLSMVMAGPFAGSSQIIGNWNFTGTTAGTGSAFNTVSIADFSPAVGSTAFNAGTEYYGHDGWPSGGLSATHYLEFRLTPGIGYALNILSLVLRMRHSNTGSSGGSGPTRFTVRSSLDGYTADIASGNLTGAYANFTVVPGAAFSNLPVAVTFRVYGHTAVLYTGGNNRLVFDDIAVNAIGIILPMTLQSFTGQNTPQGVILKYLVNNNVAGTRYTVEQSTDGSDYHVINSKLENEIKEKIQFEFVDRTLPVDAVEARYRLRITGSNGDTKLSPVVSIRLARRRDPLTFTRTAEGILVAGHFPTPCLAQVFNASGTLMLTKQITPATGTTSISVNKNGFSRGIYHLRISPGNFPPHSFVIH
jgi:hypothetical protein